MMTAFVIFLCSLLVDTAGQPVNLDGFQGKTVVVDFWYTGCGSCRLFFTEKITPLEEALADRKDIVFVSVSADKDRAKWLKSVVQELYSSPRAINVYTGGQGFKHPLLVWHGINSFPTLMIIRPDGHRELVDPLLKQTVADLQALINQ